MVLPGRPLLATLNLVHQTKEVERDLRRMVLEEMFGVNLDNNLDNNNPDNKRDSLKPHQMEPILRTYLLEDLLQE